MEHSHYPSYQVMNEKDEWDDHTQQIVASRMEMDQIYDFFTSAQVELVWSICTIFLGDRRITVLHYVLRHLDTTLSQNKGEGQRKQGIPSAKLLVQDGLFRIAETLQTEFPSSSESDNKLERLEQLIQQLSRNEANPQALWRDFPQKAFFEKMLMLSIESYYSHPQIWSEIGYGGPAYPRGYVRTQLGQLDPWEAQPEA